ncbi:MAG: T9SS type A sorting domain-containing protein [Bacteroidia bacterium]|nr:T9SS type A sorting domain-containing protein [Bacteroidia bacterium]
MKLAIFVDGSAVSLVFTPYKDEGGIFIPSNYTIYRGSAPDNLDSIASMPGGIGSSAIIYTDQNVFGDYYYKIGIVRNPPCNITDTTDTSGISNSYSNIIRNFDNGMETINLNNEIAIFPNPFDDVSIIRLKNQNNNNLIHSITIFDITGKKVKLSEDINRTEAKIERENMEKGLYILEVKADNIYRTMIIVE